jgi:hypothetical protein
MGPLGGLVRLAGTERGSHREGTERWMNGAQSRTVSVPSEQALLSSELDEVSEVCQFTAEQPAFDRLGLGGQVPAQGTLRLRPQAKRAVSRPRAAEGDGVVAQPQAGPPLGPTSAL